MTFCSTKIVGMAALISVSFAATANAATTSDSAILKAAASQATVCQQELRTILRKSEAPQNKIEAAKHLSQLKPQLLKLATDLSSVTKRQLNSADADTVEQMRICMANLANL